MFMKLTPQEISTAVKMGEDLRQKLKAYKEFDPETFHALEMLSRSIYNSYVKKRLNVGQFMVLSAMLSLQSYEAIIRDAATIEVESGRKV